MPNTLTIVFTSNPSTEPVEFPHPNTGVYVTGVQQANGTWQVVHTGVTKGTYAGLTGRLKNYPAITATIAASGPVLNNGLPAPTGYGATGTSSGTINVVVSSVVNLTAYRLLAADASAGPFTQLYQGTTAGYPHTGLSAGQTKYYQWQYVGGGFYDDSALSSVFSGITTPSTAAVNYLDTGDSITAGPLAGTGSQPANSPGRQAANRVTAPAITYTNFGYPGQGMRYLLDNKKAVVVAALLSGQRNIISFAFGTNDLNNRTSAQLHADFQEAATWALGLAGVEGVLFVPLLNRGAGTYNFALADDGVTHVDFNVARLAHNAWLLNTFGPSNPTKIRIAPITAGAATLYADAAPANTGLFESDLTHPTILGSQIQGERVRAEGLALFGGLTLRPLTAEVTNYLPGFTALTLVTSAGVVNTNGVYTAPTGGLYAETGQGGKLAAGTNGMVAYKVYGGRDVVIGWDDRPDIDGYNTVEASCFNGSGGTTFNSFDNTIQGTFPGSTTGNGWLGIRRVGSVLTLEATQAQDGTGWAVIKTFAYTSAADLYVKMYLNSTGQISYPQVFGLTADPVVAPANVNYLPGFGQLAMAAVTNLVNVNATYTAPAGGSFNTAGRGNLKLAAGVDGVIAFRLSAVGKNVVFSVATTNPGATYGADPCSIFVGGGGTVLDCFDTVGGTVTLFNLTNPAPTTGFYGLHRIGGVLSARYNDGIGGGWGPAIRTMTYSNTADLFVSMYVNSDGLMAYPQAKGLVQI